MNFRAWQARAGRVVALGILGLMVPLSAGWASDPPGGDPLAGLFCCRWEGRALGQKMAGSCCFVFGEEGALRVEILPQPLTEPWPARPTGEDVDRLLNQEGEGFTLVLGTGLQGTTNPWQERWSLLNEDLVPWIRLAARVTATGRLSAEEFALLGGTAGRGSLLPRPRFLANPSGLSRGRIYRMELPELKGKGLEADPSAEPGGFRHSHTTRSRGRGGDAEILQVRIAGPEQALLFRSSRKPGQLLITPPVRIAVENPGPEVFAPLWPLADLLRISWEEKIRELP